jgi:hypothetical protein
MRKEGYESIVNRYWLVGWNLITHLIPFLDFFPITNMHFVDSFFPPK